MNKKYTLEMLNVEGRFAFHSTNDGFNALELLGLLTWKQQDIISQINGDIEPDIVQRNVIEDESEVAE